MLLYLIIFKMLPVLRVAIVEAEHRRKIRLYNLERRLMRDASDPFSLSDKHFTELFRLNKDMVHYLFDELSIHMTNSHQYNAISSQLKIFASLVFFATGTYQRMIGNSFNISMSQNAISRSVTEVSALIVEHLSDRFIKFPQTVAEKNIVKALFMEKNRFPGVIGAIDCTHVAIIAPPVEEHNYYNRKGYHSKNVQIVSLIIYIVINFKYI